MNVTFYPLLNFNSKDAIMTKLELGQTSTETSLLGLRDAFHSPCVAVRCNDPIRPGQKVSFTNEDRTWVESACGQGYDAIADPFIATPMVGYGIFWVFLRPGLVKNLTHNFAIGDETEDEAKRKNNIEPEEDEDTDDYCIVDGC